MIQITYEPALDTYNAVFRMTRMWEIFINARELEIDRVRILDFYLLFPFLISRIRFRPQDRKFKRLAKEFEYKRPYGRQPEESDLLRRMQPMQSAALQTLAAEGFVYADDLSLGMVRPTSKPIPPAINDRVKRINDRETNLLECLSSLARDYPLLGPDGLKARSELLEFRYDAV